MILIRPRIIFSKKTKIFLIHNESETITNAPTRADGETEAKYLFGLALALQGSDKPQWKG
jgi:hypothetical protein